MRLSESLRRNIMETGVGNIINKFKAKSRRDVLFFEDILASYIKECEKAGYGKEMEEIGHKWMNLVNRLVPDTLLKLPVTIVFNLFLKKTWINLGYMDDLKVTKQNGLITIDTENEIITRIIGPNKFAVGVYKGILNVLLKSEIECVKASQSKTSCKYVFRPTDSSFKTDAKEKSVYNNLNNISATKGFNLKNALKKGVFRLTEENRLYFRKKPVIPLENTVFHLISEQNTLSEKVPLISFDFFRNIIKESSDDKKLVLLKNLLQIMGWGTVNIMKEKDKISVKIENPPFGLQKEEDNWKFLTSIIQGYLWLIDKKIKSGNVKIVNRHLLINFTQTKK